MIKKKLLNRITATACIVVTLLLPMEAYAHDNPYDSYNYNYWEDIVITPAPYELDRCVKGEDYQYNGDSIGAFNTPQDMCSTGDNIFVADTGNHRIIKFDADMNKVVDIISEFDNNGSKDTFNAPTGVAVSAETKCLYIADSQNNRIVVLNEDNSFNRIIDNPQSEVLEDGYVFIPLKVTVDYAERVYVIAQNMFEGIMVFETDGNFSGFFGTISVKISLWEKFWRKLATKEERKRSQLFIPTEFTGIDIDPDGFVYATNIDSEGIQGVRRLNPKGQDVIKKGVNNNLGGDLDINGYSDYAGPSQFTDVTYREKGIYSCLDRKRGRIFTYDHEGNLLYIFGGLGTIEGTFSMPVSIEKTGNNLCVLDSQKACVTYFKETEYGNLINRAVSLRYEGDETEATKLWQQVLLIDENNELANTGIGKAYLTGNDYKNAMKYLKLGMSRDYYSVAFKRYRNEILKEYANVYLTVIAILIVGAVVIKRTRKKRAKK